MRAIQQFKVRLKHADGNLGLPEAAPFDTIIAAAAASCACRMRFCSNLHLVAECCCHWGREIKYLVLVERRAEGCVETRLDSVRFVPLLSGLE